MRFQRLPTSRCLALHSRDSRDSGMMVEVVKGKTSWVVLQVVLVCAVSNEGKLLKENFTLLTFVILFYRGRQRGLKTLQRRNLNRNDEFEDGTRRSTSVA